MFELSQKEFSDLRSQIMTLSQSVTRYTTMAFIVQSFAMLSSVLKSEPAIHVNFQ